MPDSRGQPQSLDENKTKNTKSKLKFVLVLGTVITLLGLAFGGYLYITKDKSETSVTDLNSTEILDTSDWKKYEDSELGASFQYPPEWEAETIRGLVSLSNQDFLAEGSTKKLDYSEQTPLPEDFIILDFTQLSNSDVSQLSEYSTAEDWFNDFYQKKEKAFELFAYDINSVKNITINQKPAIVVKDSLRNIAAAVVFIQDEGSVFIIVVQPYDKIEDKIVLQILSTFKAL